MSSAPTPALAEPVAGHLRTWSECLAEVLGQIAGTPIACKSPAQAPEGLAAAADEDLWVLVTYSGAMTGELAFRIPSPPARTLARALMADNSPDDGIPAQLSEELREAALELLRQVAGLVASRLKSGRGDVILRLEAGAAPAWPAAATAFLSAALASPTSFEARLSAALVQALEPKTEPEPKPEPESKIESAPAASSGSKLDALMGVELAVTLRFGGRRMLLKDILDLCAGAVVELDRQVQEPVDLLLDGRLVARGEVVVVDGNYGLRVTELLGEMR